MTRIRLNRERYMEMLCDPFFRMRKAKERAIEFGVSQVTIYRWDQSITKEEWEGINKKKADYEEKVKSALMTELLRKATSKDTKALEIALQMYGLYNPKSDVTHRVEMNPADMADTMKLYQRYAASLPEVERAEIVKGIMGREVAMLEAQVVEPKVVGEGQG